MRQVADARQADQVVARIDPLFGRRHSRERNQLILLAMDRQQWYRFRLPQSPSEVTARAPELVADEHPLVFQGTVRARPQHQGVAVVPGLGRGEESGPVGRPAAKQFLDVEPVVSP